MSDVTDHLKLPLLAASQAQKHVTHNEALVALDRLIFLTVQARDQPTPPALPEEGEMWIAGPAASESWAGKDNQVAVHNGSYWEFHEPRTGWLAFVTATAGFCFFDGSEWQDLGGGNGLAELRAQTVAINGPALGGGSLTVHGAETRFRADPDLSDDVRLIVDKETTAATASLIFQTGTEGHAEIGLAGNDDLSLKVSADGTGWLEALRLDGVSGHASFGAGAEIAGNLAVNGTVAISGALPNIVLTDTDSTGGAHTTTVSLRDSAGQEKAWFGLGSGSSSAFTFLSHYPDGFSFYAYGGNYPIEFLQNGASRLRVHDNGFVGVNMAAPTAHLHIGGVMRLGSYSASALPSASAFGAGSVVYVADAAGVSALAFSDGSNWRRSDSGSVL